MRITIQIDESEHLPIGYVSFLMGSSRAFEKTFQTPSPDISSLRLIKPVDGKLTEYKIENGFWILA